MQNLASWKVNGMRYNWELGFKQSNLVLGRIGKMCEGNGTISISIVKVEQNRNNWNQSIRQWLK